MGALVSSGVQTQALFLFVAALSPSICQAMARECWDWHCDHCLPQRLHSLQASGAVTDAVCAYL